MNNLLSNLKIKKTFKGGSLSSTSLVNHNIFGDCILKTVSTEKNREYGFVRFSSQIKRHNLLRSKAPKLFPSILKLGIDEISKQAYCFYEYKNGSIPFIEFLLNNPSKENIDLAVKNLFKAFENIHNYSLDDSIPNGSLDYYVKEEMLRPVREFNKYFKNINFKFNSEAINNPIELEDLIKFHYDKIDFSSKKSFLIHGNSTLENILINSNSLEISFIDPYDETYFDCNIADFSQVLQCSKYYYGLRMLEKPLTLDNNFYEFPLVNKSFLYFNEIFEMQLNNMNVDKDLLKLLTASQFTRLLPFRIQSNDLLNAKYFYSLSFYILK